MCIIMTELPLKYRVNAIKEYTEATIALDDLIRTALSQRVMNAHPSPLHWWRIKQELYQSASPPFLSWHLFLPALEKARVHSLSLGYTAPIFCNCTGA